LREFAKKLLNGIFNNDADHFLALFWAVDDGDDEFDESKWCKANPLIDSSPYMLDAIRKEAIEAKQMPSKLAEFRIKRLNRPSSTADGWVDLVKWQACGGPVDLEWLRQFPCYGGLDLAATTDLTSFRLVWNVEGVYYTHGWRWVPESATAYRTERGTVPYAAWVTSGLLKQTSGDVVDYAVIEADVLAVVEHYNVQQVAFDRWNASDLVNRLTEAEVPLIEFVQGPKSYHPAMQALERAYISGKLAHGADPVLTWCASNVVARRDQNMNMAPDKKKSADKIDDMAALLMAVGISVGGVNDDQDFDDFIMRPIGLG
jgi:phage terminase large subunit-like protein